MKTRLPDRGSIDQDAPIRLSTAATLLFPDGSMTASGLRRECARGRLVIERIAGKDFTTLRHVERMRELCRVQVKALGCSNDDRDIGAESSLPKPFGSSKTVGSISPQEALRARLKQ